jgi:hypothetical protein
LIIQRMHRMAEYYAIVLIIIGKYHVLYHCVGMMALLCLKLILFR